MTDKDELNNQEPAEELDEAALNEEASRELAAMVAEAESSSVGSEEEEEDDAAVAAPQSQSERAAVVEALIFVSDEPLSVKVIAGVLKEDRGVVEETVKTLAEEFNSRNGGLQLREVAGGWQFATRPEHHEFVRKFLRTRPSAKLTIASLETLAVIAYRQPVTSRRALLHPHAGYQVQCRNQRLTGVMIQLRCMEDSNGCRRLQ